MFARCNTSMRVVVRASALISGKVIVLPASHGPVLRYCHTTTFQVDCVTSHMKLSPRGILSLVWKYNTFVDTLRTRAPTTNTQGFWIQCPLGSRDLVSEIVFMIIIATICIKIDAHAHVVNLNPRLGRGQQGITDRQMLHCLE